MNETIETKVTDKRDWYKDNQLSETELKELLDEKLKRVMKYKLVYPVRKK